MDRSRYPVRLLKLHDPDAGDVDVSALTPQERMELVWRLTLDAWAMAEGISDEPRLQRHAVRLVRGRG